MCNAAAVKVTGLLSYSFAFVYAKQN